MRRIVHVSGSPGSGKTTLGLKLSGFDVIDTDELISDAEGETLYQFRETGEHDRALAHWKKMFQKNIQTAYEKSTANTVVFTGILNHWSPDGSILEMPFPNVEKYFIDMPLAQLIRQFYTRYAKEMGDDAEFWHDIAEERYTIPSSADYLKAHHQEKQWHLEHGYALLSADEIVAHIKAKCSVCYQIPMFRCQSCTIVYCSDKCQKVDWLAGHKNIHSSCDAIFYLTLRSADLQLTQKPSTQLLHEADARWELRCASAAHDPTESAE
jgi:endogenous inhibitor of DNA gyrase (YacG/DUF329 family)